MKHLVREQVSSHGDQGAGKSAGFKQPSAKRKAPSTSDPLAADHDSSSVEPGAKRYAVEREDAVAAAAPVPAMPSHAPDADLPSAQGAMATAARLVRTGAIPKKDPNRPVTSNDNENTIFVGNLVEGVSQDALHLEFNRFGHILDVRIIYSKGIGFIRFSNEESCRKAMVMDGELFQGARLRVMPARSQKPQDSAPGDAEQEAGAGSLAGGSRDGVGAGEGTRNGGTGQGRNFRHYDDIAPDDRAPPLPSNPHEKPTREGFREEYARLADEAGAAKQREGRDRQLISYDDL
eukprot:TRINITY_DN37423_c0_g1_i1.p1 TRINITY_DN37423_c0_g1~~TRINITY_DN37423_c0_g1_i1.p1  ORF type:complete len:291 (-),score=40.71 TRINITY_DN37423_c0_g1_i1:228-1100(-)